MLQLFQSIFAKSDATQFPDELIERAIERAVDGTDPRLRGLPGYRKKMRKAVVHAVEHVVTLVEGLPAPLEITRASVAADPELIAYFASFAQAQELLANDSELGKWLESAEATANSHTVMLLLMEKEERKVFGVAYQGEMLSRDVAQTTVSFSGHRWLDPTAAEAETRRLLKRRAFDHLLTQALARITAAHTERTELERERYLLRQKSKALAAGRWGFDAESGSPPDPRALEQQLAQIESELKALGAGPGLLQLHLDYVVETLSQAETNFWSERCPLVVDRMGVKQAQVSATSPEITLTILHNRAGRQRVARLVTLPAAALS